MSAARSGRERLHLGGGGPRPAGAEVAVRARAGVKEGAHGGTMGSPVILTLGETEITFRRESQ